MTKHARGSAGGPASARRAHAINGRQQDFAVISIAGRKKAARFATVAMGHNEENVHQRRATRNAIARLTSSTARIRAARIRRPRSPQPRLGVGSSS